MISNEKKDMCQAVTAIVQARVSRIRLIEVVRNRCGVYLEGGARMTCWLREELGDAKILTCTPRGVVMAFIKMEETGWSTLEERNSEFHFGHVKFEVLIRYPSVEWAFSSREKSELMIYVWELSPSGIILNTMDCLILMREELERGIGSKTEPRATQC